jgi:50S ribosomal protein L16 3-hydroxylase
MLYLPPGVPHHGVALGACMTYSIGMRAPSQAELVGDFVDSLVEAMPEDARYIDADLAPARGDGEIDDAAIARLMRAMPWMRWSSADAASSSRTGKQALAPAVRPNDSTGDALDVSVLRNWFGCFITRYRSAQSVAANPQSLTDTAFARAVAADADLQRNPWSRCAWMREDRGAVLFVAGERYACSSALARAVCANTRFPLGAAGNARDRMVLRALIDAGHLAIMRASKPRSSR